MRKFLAHLLAFSFLFVFAPSAYADSAFGIEYGGALPAVKEDRGDGVFIITPPKPHSTFEDYWVKYTESHGVCFIMSFSQFNENDKYATSAILEFDKISRVLSKKYSNRKDWIEYVGGGAFQGNEYYAYALYAGHRKHASWWTPKANSHNDFDYIELSIKATEAEETYLALAYQNEGHFNDCSNSITAEEDDAL